MKPRIRSILKWTAHILLGLLLVIQLVHSAARLSDADRERLIATFGERKH